MICVQCKKDIRFRAERYPPGWFHPGCVGVWRDARNERPMQLLERVTGTEEAGPIFGKPYPDAKSREYGFMQADPHMTALQGHTFEDW